VSQIRVIYTSTDQLANNLLVLEIQHNSCPTCFKLRPKWFKRNRYSTIQRPAEEGDPRDGRWVGEESMKGCTEAHSSRAAGETGHRCCSHLLCAARGRINQPAARPTRG